MLGLRTTVKRDKRWVFGRPPSGVNAGFVFPPSGLRPPSRVPMKKMRAFFSWEPRPPQAGEGIFPCTIRDWMRARRDEYWPREQPPSRINIGFVGSRQAGKTLGSHAGWSLAHRASAACFLRFFARTLPNGRDRHTRDFYLIFYITIYMDSFLAFSG